MMRLSLALALVLGAALPAAAKDMKIATVAPEGTPWYTALTEFDKELREKTGGSLGLKIYPGGVQGDEKVVLRKVKAGQLQAAALTGMGLGEILPWVRLLELPFQYRSGDEVDFVREKLDERLRAEFKNRGYMLVGWSEVGTATLFSNKQLKGVDDVKGAKPWLWEGDPLAAASFRAFGVNPTPLALPDVLTSLQTGLIDTVYSAPTACIGLQWFTKLKYRIDVPLSIATGGTLVSKKFFDGLTPEQQTTLLEVGKKYEKRLIEQSRKDNLEGIQVLKEKGLETIAWPPSEVARNEEIGLKVSEELAGEGEGKLFPKAMLDEVLGLLKEYRKGKS
jgi:TRAP-type transport system periplasmic protein